MLHLCILYLKMCLDYYYDYYYQCPNSSSYLLFINLLKLSVQLNNNDDNNNFPVYYLNCLLKRLHHSQICEEDNDPSIFHLPSTCNQRLSG